MQYVCDGCKGIFNEQPAFSQSVIFGVYEIVIMACKKCSTCPDCKCENGLHYGTCKKANSTDKRVAIVGTSTHMTDNEERDIRQFVGLILQRYDTKNWTVISGGAKGVDIIAIEIAKSMGFKTYEYKPTMESWYFYRKRNLQIATDCDELYCLSIPVHKIKCYHHNEPQEHEKTAGCWTMNKALSLNKQCQLLVSLPR